MSCNKTSTATVEKQIKYKYVQWKLVHLFFSLSFGRISREREIAVGEKVFE